MNRTINGPNAPNMMSIDQSSNDTHYTPTAGLRIPNTLKLSYPDKIPKIMQTLRTEGASDKKINETL